MRSTLIVLPLLAAAVGLVFAAPDSEAYERGRKLFHDTQNDFYASCAMCHNLLPEERERKEAEHLGPGPTLWGAALREGWRNMKTYDDVGEASERCAKWYQERKKGLTPPQQADLVAFLSRHGPKDQESLPMRDLERKPDLLEDTSGGDAEKGKQLLERHCVLCHNPAETALSFAFQPHKRRADAVVRKVRGYNAQGKWRPQDHTMSWFSTDRLSDEELRHILAYVAK